MGSELGSLLLRSRAGMNLVRGGQSRLSFGLTPAAEGSNGLNPTFSTGEPGFREAAVGLERGEAALHPLDDDVVGLLDLQLAHVDGLEHLDRDLGGQRDVAEHVADVHHPGQRQRAARRSSQ